MRAAASLLSRATDLLPEREPARVELLPELGAVLTETGAWQEAEAVLTEAIEEARILDDRSSEGLAIVRSLWLHEHSGRFVSNHDALPGRARAIGMFEELGDEGGLADGWMLLGSIEFWNGRAGRAVEAADRAIEYARRANDPRREFEALRARAGWELWGPTPAGEAASTFEDLMERPAAADPRSRTTIARSRAVIEAMRGNFDLARELVEAAKASAREFGLEGHYAAGLTTGGYVAMLEGEPGRAEQELAEAVGIYRAIGDLGHLSSYAPALADALSAQGRDDEALPLTEEAERASIEGDIDAQVHWRRVRAKILAHRGELDEAVRLATEAADLARPTDDLDKRGRALMDLAEVLRLAGRSEESVAAAREAVDAFERKGNVVMTTAARRLLRGPAASM